ncbi:MAG: hypothetical protein GYA55_12435 [SAR324 cluster bacterium]|uniref:Uncharacterized protein n=1 Tax=SAR324 cluster bacterium TaxID=2024889 RepID=A0A7X9FTC5_9DELT|nr:hypothetical protein [SAR324 cluster bacterium]
MTLRYAVILILCLPLVVESQSGKNFAATEIGSIGSRLLMDAANEAVKAKAKTGTAKIEESPEEASQGQGVRDMFEKIDPIFPQDSAATTFAKETKLGGNTSIGNFDAEVGVKKPTPKPTISMRRDAERNNAIPDQFKNPYPKDRQSIISTFGDPSEDVPIKAIDNAPPPFKAMMAAHQAGDQELAHAYARQYVRYIKNTQASVENINKMTDLAMEMEGMRQPSGREDSDYDEESRRLIEKDLKRIRGEAEDGLYVANMQPEIRELLNEAEEAEEEGRPRPTATSKKREELFPSGYDPGFDEKKARQLARRSIAGRVPVDPKGQAQVYIFMRPDDAKNAALAQEVETLNQRVKGRDVKILGVVPVEHMSPYDIQQLQASQNLSFPIRASLSLGPKLGVMKYPSIIVAAPNIARYVLEEGFRPYYYIDELVKAVQGVKMGSGGRNE